MNKRSSIMEDKLVWIIIVSIFAAFMLIAYLTFTDRGSAYLDTLTNFKFF